MNPEKEKKVRMFLKQNGKCDYCGCDMILSFSDKESRYENLATFDHKYNRDHEKRTEIEPGEKRIFLVCRKCNNEKSKTEPNNQQAAGLQKSVKKLVPKAKWSDAMFMERIEKVIAEEIDFSKQIGQIDKHLRRLKGEKIVLEGKLSKKAKYRNQLINSHELSKQGL